MTRFLTTLALVGMMMTASSFAKENFISEDLFTYMHTGPGSNYRIIGSVDAGTKISILTKNADSGYSQIVDDRDRKGWVESKYITTTPGLKIRVPALEAQLADVTSRLKNAKNTTKENNKDLIDSLEQRTIQVEELEEQTSELNQKLIGAQSEIRELSARIDTQKDDLLMRYFTYGGIVAGIGLLFGLILPHVLPRRKKNPNGWA